MFPAPPPALAAAHPTPPPGDARRGVGIYETRCGACHSPDANRIGPAHRGVFGRKAGSAPSFAYTPALKSSGVTWTAANLDRWLSGPTKMLPGVAMGFSLAAPQDRADVIAYLRQISPRK